MFVCGRRSIAHAEVFVLEFEQLNLRVGNCTVCRPIFVLLQFAFFGRGFYILALMFAE